ncbi:MAG: alpha/beta fold hydrolase [Hyphomicrobiales bacterium]
MPYAGVNGASLFYTDAGEGATVLLIHGWTCDGTDWSWQVPALAESYRVIVPDLRGHGRSSIPEDGYTVPRFADDLAELLTALKATPAVVAGHSLGGAIAVALGTRHPEAVRAVVSVDAAYGYDPALEPRVAELVAGVASPEGLEVARQFFLSSFYPPSSPPNLRVWHSRRLLGNSPHVVAKTFAGLTGGPGSFFYRPAAEAALAQLSVPLLAFRGGETAIATSEWERACAKHPASKAIGWPENGHFLHQERPADFNAELCSWLAALPA